MKYLNVAGCFLLFGDKFLVLQRHPRKSEGGKWGLPAGKIDLEKETIEDALVREIKEETGIAVDTSMLRLFDERTFVFPQETSHFYTYVADLDHVPEVLISTEEHTAFQWVTNEECLKMENAIKGLHELVKKLCSSSL